MTDKIELIRGLLSIIETRDDAAIGFASKRLSTLFHENELTWDALLSPVPADKRGRLAKVLGAIGPGSPQEARNALAMARRMLDGSGLSFSTAFALPAGMETAVRPQPAPPKRMVTFKMFCSKTRQGYIAHAEQTGEDTLVIVDAKPLPKTSVFAREAGAADDPSGLDSIEAFFSISIAPTWKCPCCGTGRTDVASYSQCPTCSEFHCMGHTADERWLGQCGTCSWGKDDFVIMERFGVHGSSYEKARAQPPTANPRQLLGQLKRPAIEAAAPKSALPAYDPRKLPLEKPKPKPPGSSKWWVKPPKPKG